jgi:hypothetical protein
MARKTNPPTSTRKTTRHVEAPLVIKRETVSAERRAQMIAEHAYYLAAERGFSPGNELGDWLAAEAAIDRQLV